MSSGILGGKQKMEFGNARNRGRLCLLSQKEAMSYAQCTVWVATKLTSLLLAVRKSTVASASKKTKNDHFHP